MANRKKKNDVLYTMILDDTQLVRYKRKKKHKVRHYLVTLHRNNNTRLYWGGFGYWLSKQERVKMLWQSTSLDCEELKERLLETYHNHLDILEERLILLKVKQTLLDEGLAPGTIDGEGLPSDLYDENFVLLGKSEDSDFDIKIKSEDGRVFVVAREHFFRTRPTNFPSRC